MTYDKVIERQLKIIEEGDEILTPQEFALICEAEYFRPSGEKWYSKHRSLSSTGAKVGAAVASVATLGVYGWFRKKTDKCKQTCGKIPGSKKHKCIAICNMNAAKGVIAQIDKAKGKLNSIKDPEKKAKALETFKKEKEKWYARYNKYKTRVTSMSHTSAQMDV